MNMLKLLVEEPCYEYDVLIDEKNNKEQSTLYIKGPYLMAEKKNKNGRIYNLSEMVPEVNRYTAEMINEKRSIGELNHPASVEVNPERSCHMITELKRDGDIYIGKSKILSNPIGQVTRALIMDGVRLGISSRALGKLIPGGGGNQVQGFHLICTDVVHDPSVNTPDGTQAFVNGIFEAKNWILNNGMIVEAMAYENFEKTLGVLPKRGEAKEALMKKAIFDILKALSTPKNNI
jgi:hypothetical protein